MLQRSSLLSLIFWGSLAQAQVPPPAVSPRSVSPVKEGQAQAPLTKPLPGTDEIDSETRVVLRAISERYRHYPNWHATFLQKTYSVGLGKTTVSEGEFYFGAPNRFRYSVMRPEASDFISNGTKAWHVQYPEGRQKPAQYRVFANLKKLELDRYLILLRGIDAVTPAKEKALNSQFRIKGHSEPQILRLELEPRRQSEVARLTLFVKQNGGLLDHAEIEDSLGNTTTITIVQEEKLSQVDPALFEPKLPSGSKPLAR